MRDEPAGVGAAPPRAVGHPVATAAMNPRARERKLPGFGRCRNGRSRTQWVRPDTETTIPCRRQPGTAIYPAWRHRVAARSIEVCSA